MGSTGVSKEYIGLHTDYKRLRRYKGCRGLDSDCSLSKLGSRGVPNNGASDGESNGKWHGLEVSGIHRR